MRGGKRGSHSTTTAWVQALLVQPMSQAQLREATGLGRDSIQSALSRLLENGRITRIGAHGASRYVLSDVMPPTVVSGARLDLPDSAGPSVPAVAPAWPAPGPAPLHFGCPLLSASHAMEASR